MRLSRTTSRQSGFTAMEMLMVVFIILILAAATLPGAFTAIKGYRLHADATSIAGFLNVIRMKAASQYAPYRLIIDTGGK